MICSRPVVSRRTTRLSYVPDGTLRVSTVTHSPATFKGGTVMSGRRSRKKGCQFSRLVLCCFSVPLGTKATTRQLMALEKKVAPFCSGAIPTMIVSGVSVRLRRPIFTARHASRGRNSVATAPVAGTGSSGQERPGVVASAQTSWDKGTYGSRHTQASRLAPGMAPASRARASYWARVQGGRIVPLGTWFRSSVSKSVWTRR